MWTDAPVILAVRLRRAVAAGSTPALATRPPACHRATVPDRRADVGTTKELHIDCPVTLGPGWA